MQLAGSIFTLEVIVHKSGIKRIKMFVIAYVSSYSGDDLTRLFYKKENFILPK